MSRVYLVFTRPKAQPLGLAGIRRGNDWHMQQALLHQIKAIEFQVSIRRTVFHQRGTEF